MSNFRIIKAYLLRQADRASDLAEQLRLLDADPSSGEKTLRRKYIEKMKEVHPDKGGSKEQAQEINKAYQDIKEYNTGRRPGIPTSVWEPTPDEFPSHLANNWLDWILQGNVKATPELKTYIREKILASPMAFEANAISAHRAGVINLLDPKDRELMHKVQHVADQFPTFLAKLDQAGLIPEGNPDARARALAEIKRDPRSVGQFAKSKLVTKGDKEVVPVLVAYLRENPGDIYEIFASGIIPQDDPGFKKLVIALIVAHKGFASTAVRRGIANPNDKDIILAALQGSYPKLHKALASSPNFYGLIHKNDKIRQVLTRLGLSGPR